MEYFELWDIETRNLVDSFDDEASLRAALREIVNFETLALARRDDRGQTEWIAHGVELERFAGRAAV
jgi:hypothetical protein